MNNTPAANRIHIGFFGRRNTGKSSLVNAITGQITSLVSEIKGTTTDPVYKTMELLPLGPVMIIDSAGIDDEGELGELRVQRTFKVLNKTDIAVLVLEASASVDADTQGEENNFDVKLCDEEKKLVNIFIEKKIPYIIVLNKCDLIGDRGPGTGDRGLLFESISGYQHAQITNKGFPVPVPCSPIPYCPVSAKTGYNIDFLKETIARLAPDEESDRPLLAGLINPSEIAVLVIPIDKAAPKGRLILPQQQVIRSILDIGAVAITVRDKELKETLEGFCLGKKPSLVITDSQVFAEVSAIVPIEIPLTSFSILFARHKNTLDSSVKGIAALKEIHDGDKILICEGCTHHRQCEDIGTVKIPRMIRNFTGKAPDFSFTSGGDFPDDLSPYKMIIHCGACMLNHREVQYRQRCAADQGIPFTNYGICIAYIQGILERSIAVFKNKL